MNLIQRILHAHIGPFPVVLLGVIVLVLWLASEQNLLSNDVIGGLAALMTTGYILVAISAAEFPGYVYWVGRRYCAFWCRRLCLRLSPYSPAC